MPDLEITFDEVRKQNIEQLKILNRAIFPINYQVIQCSCHCCHSDDLVVLLWHLINSESHSLRHLPSLDMQDRIYQDILASGGVSQLGACHVFHAPCSISCAEAPCNQVQYNQLLHGAAYHNDVLVGAIACRLEAHSGNTAKMYIVTLGVLAPYRGMRIGD